MNFQKFSSELKKLRIFNLQDIFLIFPEFNTINLSSWQKKGYIKKIRNGWYIFSDIKIQGLDYYLIANRIYKPSYISLELAFNHYGIIPEGVLQFISVSTNKTQKFSTQFGVFKYKHIKPEINWGYKLIEFESQQIKIAEPEKALLDFLYLRPSMNNFDNFEAMRFDIERILEIIDLNKFENYTKSFVSNALMERYTLFLKFIKHANI